MTFTRSGIFLLSSAAPLISILLTAHCSPAYAQSTDASTKSILLQRDGIPSSEIRYEAYLDRNDHYYAYSSSAPEQTTFVGDFSPESDTRLAIMSPDLVSISISETLSHDDIIAVPDEVEPLYNLQTLPSTGINALPDGAIQITAENITTLPISSVDITPFLIDLNPDPTPFYSETFVPPIDMGLLNNGGVIRDCFPILRKAHLYHIKVVYTNNPNSPATVFHGISLFAYGSDDSNMGNLGNVVVTATSSASTQATDTGDYTDIPMQATASDDSGLPDATDQWDWQATSIQFGPTAQGPWSDADSYAPPTFSPPDQSSTSLHTIFTKSGFYQVTAQGTTHYTLASGLTGVASCTTTSIVEASDSPGVRVRFDPKAIKIGVGPTSGHKPVKAYVTPQDQANNVSIHLTNRVRLLLLSMIS